MLALTDIGHERAWVRSSELKPEVKHRQVISNSPAVKQHFTQGKSPFQTLPAFHMGFLSKLLAVLSVFLHLFEDFWDV